MLWIAWLGVAVVALAGELFTLGLFLAPFAVAAVVVAVLSLRLSLPYQLAIFGILAILLLTLVRPLVRRVIPLGGSGDTPRVGPSERYGTVVDRIERGRGQIRVGTGEFWSARSVEPQEVLARGDTVEIVGMEGLTALVRAVARVASEQVEPGVPAFGLSAREVEVLQLMAQGLSNAEIAERLVLSPRTVHHHVSHIFTKMDVDNRVEAVRLAIDRGLVRTGER